MAFLVLALLYSTPVKNPFRFALLFAPALIVANQFRLYLVIALGTLFPTLQEAVHVYFWFVDAALVLTLWWFAFASSPESLDRGGSNLEAKKRPARKIGKIRKTDRKLLTAQRVLKRNAP